MQLEASAFGRICATRYDALCEPDAQCRARPYPSWDCGPYTANNPHEPTCERLSDIIDVIKSYLWPFKNIVHIIIKVL